MLDLDPAIALGGRPARPARHPGRLHRRQVVAAVVVLVGAGRPRVVAAPRARQRAVLRRRRLLAAGLGVRCRSSPGRCTWAASPRAEDLIRPVVAPIVIGLALVALFVVGGLVVREIDPLADYVRSVLEFADQGSIPLLALITFVNGIAEELFFRGADVCRDPAPPGVVDDGGLLRRDAGHRQRDAGLRRDPARRGLRPAATRERRRARADPDARHVVGRRCSSLLPAIFG